MSKADRREQLLDAAATLLTERGTDAVTMERLAEWAEVSKALPYAHFDNSDEVLVAVYERVVFALGARITEALEQAAPGERIERVVAAYFDAVRDLGPTLAVVVAPGSKASALADPDQRLGVRFVAELLIDSFGLTARRARVAAPLTLALLTGGARAWADGDGSRHDVERAAVAAFRALTDQP